jgi:hypothetical protein
MSLLTPQNAALVGMLAALYRGIIRLRFNLREGSSDKYTKLPCQEDLYLFLD